MNVRTPSLRQHPDGRWMTKWAGRIRYLGRDQAAALQRYAEELASWHAWREGVERAMQRPSEIIASVADLAVRFLDYKTIAGGRSLERYYAKHLRRFLEDFGPIQIAEVSVRQLQELKNSMLVKGRAPKTINHDLIAVRSMFTWGAEQELIPPRNLRGCKTIPLGPPPDKALAVGTVRRMVKEAPQPVRSWLAVNYLAGCRPSEVVRLVNQQGRWTEVGIVRLTVGKTDRSSRQPRHIVLSDHALFWLETCEPRWTRLDSYSGAVRKVCGQGGPGVLRHSAATHLHQCGVSRHDVDLFLGHTPRRVSLVYNPVDFQSLRRSADRIGETLSGCTPLD